MNFDELTRRLDALDAKLERLWLGIDFVRTHIGTYLGDGNALTYLPDETAIFVNSNDLGGPSNLLNGGLYEQDNLEVLQSFVRDDTVFLDIGANLGFFAVKIGKQITRGGKVHAFEPHPKLIELMTRTLFLNGLKSVVECHDFGVSDRDEAVEFHFPTGHLGGGHIGRPGGTRPYTTVKSLTRKLDTYFDQNFACDLVKIDVEGHELSVFRGMAAIISRSPRIKILFEKLGRSSGLESEVAALLDKAGLQRYGVGASATLVELTSLHAFQEWSGYVLAAAPSEIQGETQRSRFTIFPSQLNFPSRATPVSVGEASYVEGGRGDILFHGPYWYLRRGVWRVIIEGAIKGEITLTLAERFGYKVLDLSMDGSTIDQTFICERDLINFECVARPQSRTASMNLTKIEFIRVG